MSVHTGGCQCGAVRFRIEGTLGTSSICHCRMCQKAFGNLFAPLVSVGNSKLNWTKSEPSKFQSSNHVARGFCERCGTPLTYEAPDGIAIALGAFDQPQNFPPTIQYGHENALPFTAHLQDLPIRKTSDDAAATPFLAGIVSYQHPDQD